MISILVEVDSKKLGGNMLLIPFEEAWLASNTCREILNNVLVHHLDRHAHRVILLCLAYSALELGVMLSLC